MIQFFRQNNFLTTLLLIPYTFIVRMASFYLQQAPTDMDTGGALYSIFVKAFEDRPTLSNITINLVIALTAILVNRIVIKHRLTRYQTLLPGLIYIMLVSWLEVFMSFSALHIANFFVVVGILATFKFSKKMASSIVVFDACFYFALAALFYTPYVIYLIPAILGFVNLDSFRLKELMNAIIGFFLPFFVISGLIYFFQSDIAILQGYDINKSIFKWFAELSLIDLIPLILYGSLITFSVISFGILSSKTPLQAKKKIGILYWFLLTSFGCIFFINEKNATNLLVLALPMSIILGMMVERNKAIFIEEFFHLAILGGIIFLHFNLSINILM